MQISYIYSQKSDRVWAGLDSPVWHTVHAWFLFTCMPLFPFILPLTKECRYSMNIVILSIGLDPKCSSLNKYREEAKMFSLLSFFLWCNMWFSSAGQLLDNSLDFCPRLPNPVSLNGLPSQYSAEVQTADRANQCVDGQPFLWYFSIAEIPPFKLHKCSVTKDLWVFREWHPQSFDSKSWRCEATCTFFYGWLTIIPYTV